MIDWEWLYVGTLLLTFFSFFTGPGANGTWVEALLEIQVGDTLELAIMAVLVVLFAVFKIYKWIPSRGSKRSWVPEE